MRKKDTGNDFWDGLRIISKFSKEFYQKQFTIIQNFVASSILGLDKSFIQTFVFSKFFYKYKMFWYTSGMFK